jgi:hypothetical protein
LVLFQGATGKLKVVAFAMITNGFLRFLVLVIAFASNPGPRQSKHGSARLMTTQGRTIFSFVMDHDPRFAYEAWHLSRSLIEHCGGDPSSIHVQWLPEVNARRRSLFGELGCHVYAIAPFGDGRYCNKLNQLENLRELDFDRVVLLDTDMIATSDLRPFLGSAAIQAKIVDLAKPPLATLEAIAAAADLSKFPPIRGVDASGDLPAADFIQYRQNFAPNYPKDGADGLSGFWPIWTGSGVSARKITLIRSASGSPFSRAACRSRRRHRMSIIIFILTALMAISMTPADCPATIS